MDCSRNSMDIFYLSRLRNYPNKVNDFIDTDDDNLFNEIKFYRKRILQTTKDLLRGNKISDSVNESFLDYARILVDYYKFKDKSELIQETYKKLNDKIKTDPPRNNINIEKELKKSKEIVNEQTKNVLIKPQPQSTSIKNFVNVKTKRDNKVFVPKKKNIDLKNEKFRSKASE